MTQSLGSLFPTIPLVLAAVTPMFAVMRVTIHST